MRAHATGFRSFGFTSRISVRPRARPGPNMHVVTSRRAAATRTRTQRRREDASDRATARFPAVAGASRPRPGHRPHTSRLRRSQTATQTATDGHTDGHRRPDTAGRTLDAHRETPLPYSATTTADGRTPSLALIRRDSRVYLLELLRNRCCVFSNAHVVKTPTSLAFGAAVSHSQDASGREMRQDTGSQAVRRRESTGLSAQGRIH